MSRSFLFHYQFPNEDSTIHLWIQKIVMLKEKIKLPTLNFWSSTSGISLDLYFSLNFSPTASRLVIFDSISDSQEQKSSIAGWKLLSEVIPECSIFPRIIILLLRWSNLWKHCEIQAIFVLETWHYFFLPEIDLISDFFDFSYIILLVWRWY